MPELVWWRGLRFNDPLADLLNDLAAGTPDLPLLTPTQGSYNTSVAQSGSTHAAGGAVDLSLKKDVDGQLVPWPGDEIDELLAQARRRGLVLWRRKAIDGVWPEHAHGVLDSDPELSDAADAQVADYRRGMNGLSGRYRGRDDGPRDWVGVTWWKYLEDNPPKKPATTPEEGDVICIGAIKEEGGRVYLLVPGKPKLWLSPDQFGVVTRLYPYWATLPGSPFTEAQIDWVNELVQPDSAAPRGLTLEDEGGGMTIDLVPRLADETGAH